MRMRRPTPTVQLLLLCAVLVVAAGAAIALRPRTVEGRMLPIPGHSVPRTTGVCLVRVDGAVWGRIVGGSGRGHGGFLVRSLVPPHREARLTASGSTIKPCEKVTGPQTPRTPRGSPGTRVRP